MAKASLTTSDSNPKRRRSSFVRNILLVASVALMVVTLYLIFFWVPTEANLGVSQRILYFHVPLGILGLISIVAVAIASGMYLWKKDLRWDDLAHSIAEFGVVFATLIIVTGAIWAKPVWGVWWTWDAKLTTTLILWFIYVSYLMLRAYGPKGIQQARYAAVIALIGAIDAPIIYYATEIWRNAHPDLVIGPIAESDSLESRMTIALLVSMVTFVVFFAYMLVERYSLRRSESHLDELHQIATIRH